MRRIAGGEGSASVGGTRSVRTEMSELKYLDGNGCVTNFGFVPWLKLNEWLSRLNGAKWVEQTLPKGMNRGNIIEELEQRRKKTGYSFTEGAVRFVARLDRGYGKDWRTFENERGFTHLEELLIHQPEEWRTQAREYFYTYEFKLNRESTSEEKRTHRIRVTYESEDSIESADVPIFMSSPVLVTLFHPEIAKSDRYTPLNFLLSYGVEVPELPGASSFEPAQWDLIKRQIWEDLSPLDFFFAFQKGVEQYSVDMLQTVAKQSGHTRLPLLCELDFCKVIGQRLAKHMLRREIVSWIYSHSARGELSSSRTPLSLMLAGPSGIGKTEMASELSKLLNKPGMEDAFHKVDCGMLSDANEVFGMSGAYKGSEEGSALNNYIVRRSNEPDTIGVVLLDEIEKADQDVIHGLYQVFDKGEWTNKRLNDGRAGQTEVVSCANIIFIMTTNAADSFILREAERTENHYTAPARSESGSSLKTIGECAESLESAVRLRLRASYPFTDAFLGRVSCVIPFLPLSNGDPDKNKLLGEMLTISKCFIEMRIDGMRGENGPMKLSPNVSNKEKHKMAKIIVSNVIPSAGVRSLEKCVGNEVEKKMLHDCLLKDGGVSRGSSVSFFCNEAKKTIDYRAIGRANISEAHSTETNDEPKPAEDASEDSSESSPYF